MIEWIIGGAIVVALFGGGKSKKNSYSENNTKKLDDIVNIDKSAWQKPNLVFDENRFGKYAKIANKTQNRADYMKAIGVLYLQGANIPNDYSYEVYSNTDDFSTISSDRYSDRHKSYLIFSKAKDLRPKNFILNADEADMVLKYIENEAKITIQSLNEIMSKLHDL